MIGLRQSIIIQIFGQESDFSWIVVTILGSLVVLSFVLLFRKKWDIKIKKNQRIMVYLPIFLIMFLSLIFYFCGLNGKVDILTAIITAITFIFTLINIYISNFWSEIANHRNATLINVPYIDIKNENGNRTYINAGEATVKYLKLYENEENENEEKKYYSEFNDGVTSEKDKKKHRVKNTTKPDGVCLDAYIYSELKNKFQPEKNYSNVLIHTDFSQRNIFIIYTYMDKEKKEISQKRFTPMSYDMNYKILVGQENISKVIYELQLENKKQEVKFVNTVIDDYTKMMKY